MTGHEYLEDVLRQQTLQDWELGPLQRAREDIESLLRNQFGSGPRFYYAGSYRKGTMVRLNYDLDIVIYFSPESFQTLRDMYESVYSVLSQRFSYGIQQKTVSIQIAYSGGFHIDVVPGRLIGNSDNEVNLYRTDAGTSLKTSIQQQVQYIRDSGFTNTMRLMKIWRERHNLEFKSFALELLVIRALSGQNIRGYDNKVMTVLNYIRDNILTVSLVDPSNSNNIISDSILKKHKESMRKQALASLGEQYWTSIIW